MARYNKPDANNRHELSSLETLTALLRNNVAKRPDEIFAEIAGIPLSYGKLDDASTRLSVALPDLGVTPGTRVALQLGNNAEFLIAFFAIARMGPLSCRSTRLCLAHFCRRNWWIAEPAA